MGVSTRCLASAVLVAVLLCRYAESLCAQPPSADDAKAIEAGLVELRSAIDKLHENPRAESSLPDVEVYAKAAEWILRHHEFYKPEFAAHTKAALKMGLARAADLAKGAADWEQMPGRRV